MAGVRVQPLVSEALHDLPSITATPVTTPTYTVSVAWSTAIGNAPAPARTVAGTAAQPLESAASHRLPSITETVPDVVFAT